MAKEVIYRSADIACLKYLSSRALIALAREGIRTVGQLQDMSHAALCDIPNVGVLTADKIIEVLSRFDIRPEDNDVDVKVQIAIADMRKTLESQAKEIADLRNSLQRAHGRCTELECKRHGAHDDDELPIKSLKAQCRRLFSDGQDMGRRMTSAHCRIDVIADDLSKLKDHVRELAGNNKEIGNDTLARAKAYMATTEKVPTPLEVEQQRIIQEQVRQIRDLQRIVDKVRGAVEEVNSEHSS